MSATTCVRDDRKPKWLFPLDALAVGEGTIVWHPVYRKMARRAVSAYRARSWRSGGSARLSARDTIIDGASALVIKRIA